MRERFEASEAEGPSAPPPPLEIPEPAISEDAAKSEADGNSPDGAKSGAEGNSPDGAKSEAEGNSDTAAKSEAEGVADALETEAKSIGDAVSKAEASGAIPEAAGPSAAGYDPVPSAEMRQRPNGNSSGIGQQVFPGAGLSSSTGIDVGSLSGISFGLLGRAVGDPSADGVQGDIALQMRMNGDSFTFGGEIAYRHQRQGLGDGFYHVPLSVMGGLQLGEHFELGAKVTADFKYLNLTDENGANPIEGVALSVLAGGYGRAHWGLFGENLRVFAEANFQPYLIRNRYQTGQNSFVEGPVLMSFGGGLEWRWR